MVSAHSKVPDAAADLVRYLSSVEIQKKIAIQFSVLPTRTALYGDRDVLAKKPVFKTMLDVLNNAVARPSTVAGADYNQRSTAFSKTQITSSPARSPGKLPSSRLKRWLSGSCTRLRPVLTDPLTGGVCDFKAWTPDGLEPDLHQS
jgi:hypothetical protein